MAQLRQGTPFLYDDTSGDIVGLRDPDGSEFYFSRAAVGPSAQPDPYLWTLPESERGYKSVAQYGNITAGTPVTPGTYDASGLGTALTSAESGSKLVRLDADLALASNVTIPADVTVYSLIGARVTGTGKLVLSSRSQIIGLRFVGAATTAVAYLTSSAIFGSRVACCDFTPSVSDSVSIKDESTADNTLHRGNIIERNYFSGHSYAFSGIRAEAMLVQWNECTGSTGRNFQMAGGRSSVFRSNRINGGVTGISWLLDAQYGTYAADCRENVVSCNWIRGVTEEAISADIFGNNATSVSVRDQFAINSKQGSYNSNPEFVVNRAARMFPANRAIVFVTGAIAGKCARLVYDDTVVSSTTIYLRAANDQFSSAEFSAIQPGDVVAVGHAFCDGVIERNHVDVSAAAAVGVYLYGNCFRNRVSANVVRHSGGGAGIRVDSLNGLLASSDSNKNTTTAVQCAPSSDNSVLNNTVVSGRIDVRGYSFANEAGSFPAQYKNAVRNNVCSAVESGRWTGSGGSLVEFTVYTSDANDPSYESNNATLPAASAGVSVGPFSDAGGNPFALTPSIGAVEIGVVNEFA